MSSGYFYFDSDLGVLEQDPYFYLLTLLGGSFISGFVYGFVSGVIEGIYKSFVEKRKSQLTPQQPVPPAPESETPEMAFAKRVCWQGTDPKEIDRVASLYKTFQTTTVPGGSRKKRDKQLSEFSTGVPRTLPGSFSAVPPGVISGLSSSRLMSKKCNCFPGCSCDHCKMTTPSELSNRLPSNWMNKKCTRLSGCDCDHCIIPI